MIRFDLNIGLAVGFVIAYPLPTSPLKGTPFVKEFYDGRYSSTLDEKLHIVQ